MMINILLALSESDKRVLIALILVFIIILVLFGYLVKLIKYILKRQANYVDKSMYDIVDANMVSNEKEFRKVSFEKNRRKFYFEARVPFAVMVGVIIVVLVIMAFPTNYSFETIGFYISELRLDLDWSSSFTTLLGWLPALQNWPSVTHSPTFYFTNWDAWVSYIFLLALIYGGIHFLVCVCAFAARNHRTLTASHDVFSKDLKQLADAKNLNNIHNKKPTEEMKDAVEDEVK
jgi:hypothetical protein